MAIIATIFAFLLLSFLSAWQVQRLFQKEALIASLAAAKQAKPGDGLPKSEDLSSLGFRTFTLKGRFLHDKEFHLAARYYKGKLGYHILTPFLLAKPDARIILLNRGWVASEQKNQAAHPEGEQTLVAMLRTDRDHNFFTPHQTVEKNIWFWRDIANMSQVSQLNLLPVTGDVLGKAEPQILPIPTDGDILLRNDHLGYAITWFAIGLSALVIFFFYHWRVERS